MSAEEPASFDEQAAEIHRKVVAFRAYKKSRRLRNRIVLQTAALIMAGLLFAFQLHGLHRHRHHFRHHHAGYRHL